MTRACPSRPLGAEVSGAKVEETAAAATDAEAAFEAVDLATVPTFAPFGLAGKLLEGCAVLEGCATALLDAVEDFLGAEALEEEAALGSLAFEKSEPCMQLKHQRI